jgi:hypothetical protein
MAKKLKLDPRLKEHLNLSEHDDEFITKLIMSRRKFACKPCWELKYCPYGAIVEEYPILPTTLDEQLESNKIYQGFLDTDMFGHEPLGERRQGYEQTLANFNPDDYITEIPIEIKEMECNVFAHMCPVFFDAVEFAESSTTRRRGRYIPFNTKVRVVRRDNYTCQRCGKHLLDSEVEFDHIIPIAKGGSSEEHNIRLTCYVCNREKTDQIEM